MAMMTIALNANAMSFTQAQREALFLTDKMAYELNLTDEQYDACYEINLDYLMSVSTVDDLYGTYWTRRNYDMGYVLFDWQLEAFRAASYFYRPLYWDAGCWHFVIYARYPRRTFFYFSHPTVYVSYRGGHSWRMNGGHSYYHGHQDRFRSARTEHVGMRDRFDNRRFDKSRPAISNNNRPNMDRGNNNRFGNVRQNSDNGSRRQNMNRSFESRTNTMRQNGFSSDRGVRSSSTRVTVNRESSSPSRSFSRNSSPSRSFSQGGSSSSRSVKSSSSSRGIRSSSAANRK